MKIMKSFGYLNINSINPIQKHNIMKKIINLFLLLFSITFFACTKDSGQPTTPSNNDPKDGTIWVYKQTYFNEAGSVTGTSNVTFKGVSVTISGSTWINLVNQANSQPQIAIQKRTDGWWYITYPSSTPSLWFKNPAAVNDVYSYPYGTCKVLSITESVTVPAGTYTNCTLVQGDDTNSKEDEFWFTTAGPVLVKFNTYDERTGGPASNVYKKESVELVSYTP